jgi:cell division septum initiation protein DivIVA
MNIQKELDRLEDLILSSFRIPLLGKTLVSEEALLDVLDQVRINLPKVIEEAEQVYAIRDKLLAQAAGEAQRLIEQSEQEAMRRIAADQITQSAQAQANALLTEATSEAARIRQEALQQAQEVQSGADQYAEKMLNNLEGNLGQLLQIVRNGRQTLQ